MFVVCEGGGGAVQLLIARRLVERGHAVRVMAPQILRPRIEAFGARFVGFEEAPELGALTDEEDRVRDWEPRARYRSFQRMRDRLSFGPALAFARDVTAELEREPADAVAADFLLLGALAAAESAAVPTAALVHSIYAVPTPGLPPMGLGLQPARGKLGRSRERLLATLAERFTAPGLVALNRARAELGLDPVSSHADQIGRPARALVLTSAAFDFSATGLPANVRYVGPVLDRHSQIGKTERAALARRQGPLVVASFSTTYMNQVKLARRVLAALSELPVHGLLTTGPALDLGSAPLPANVTAHEFVPHLPLFSQASLVVTHAGHGTVMAALANGVPLVCLPCGRDQYDIAARVIAAGAGVRVSSRAGVARLRRAITTALADPELQRGAGRLASRVAAEDGVERGASELEELAGVGRAGSC